MSISSCLERHSFDHQLEHHQYDEASRHYILIDMISAISSDEGIEQLCISCRRGGLFIASARRQLIRSPQAFLNNKYCTNAIAVASSSALNVFVLPK